MNSARSGLARQSRNGAVYAVPTALQTETKEPVTEIVLIRGDPRISGTILNRRGVPMTALTNRATPLDGLLLLAGCSAHNPFILQHTTDVARDTAGPQFPAHERPVLVTAALLPDGADYRVSAEVDVGKAWYGRTLSVHEALARQARALGADAVIEVKTWFQPSGYSWWAPHGRGRAVKIVGGVTEEQLAELGLML